MLDLRFIRENPELVKENCAARRVEADVDRLVELARNKSALTTQLQDVQRQQNEVAQQTKKAKDQTERQPLIEQGKKLKEQAAAIELEMRELDGTIREIQAGVPNLTHPDSPRGEEDVVLRQVGDVPQFDFDPVDHVELCDRHKLADFESAAKVTGSNFYYLTGDGALLQMALVNYAVRMLIDEGYTFVMTPDLARSSVMEGTGYIPRGPETQIYSIADTDLCLIATAEITLAGMFADEILSEEQLPMKFVGLSHCFRTEAGAAGRATKGLFRVHQFTKVEMFAFTTDDPQESEKAHREMLDLEEKIFQGLEIPYQVLDIRAGDLGGPAYRKYDLEAWMPGRGDGGEFAEITSTSNCTDYQSRRLGIRYKQSGKKGTRFVHTLNGTAVAAGRTIIALLENHQQSDGSIKLPQALVPFMGKQVIGG